MPITSYVGLFPRLHYPSRRLCFYFSLNAWNLSRYWWIVRLIRAAAVLFDESHKKRTSYPYGGFKVSVIRIHWFSRRHITSCYLGWIKSHNALGWINLQHICVAFRVLYLYLFFHSFNPKNNNKNKHRANATAIRICCKWNTQFTTSKSLRTLYRSSMEICSHGAKEKQKPIRYMTIHFQGLAWRTGVTETSLKSSHLCVNRSPIGYGFRTWARAIRHSSSQ